MLLLLLLLPRLLLLLGIWAATFGGRLLSP
jgi:hypothetical protein